jgi:hypothetical protein
MRSEAIILAALAALSLVPGAMAGTRQGCAGAFEVRRKQQVLAALALSSPAGPMSTIGSSQALTESRRHCRRWFRNGTSMPRLSSRLVWT